MIARFLKAAQAGYRALPWSGTGGQVGPGWDSWSFLRPVEDIRLPWHNSAVGALIGWVSATLPEAPIVCKQAVDGDPDGQVVDHPVVNLLRQPSPHYDWVALLSGLILSDMVDGNAYLFKERSASGKVVGLRYLPHFQVAPQWDGAGQSFVTHYRLTQDNGQFDLSPADVIHIRNGIDPQRPRYGMSPLKAILSEVLTDNEATIYTHAILRNMGIVGAIVSAKGDVDITPDQAVAIRDRWRSQTRGTGRGDPLVLSTPVEVKEFGATPEKMVLEKVRKVPAQRICAAYRIPPSVVSLGETDPTYSNLEGYTRLAWQACVQPMQRRFASALWHGLRWDATGGIDDPALWLEFDVSQVAALQRDLNDEAARLEGLYQSGIITRAEARRGAGYDATSEDELYYTDLILGAGALDAKAALLRDVRERVRANREDYERLQASLEGHAADTGSTVAE